MPAPNPILILLACITTFLAPCASAQQPAAPQDEPLPFTRLFDTAASPAPSPQALSSRPGWRRIPEDTLSHAFAGDAILMNDRIALVIPRNAPQAQLFSHSAAGWKKRATLAPLPNSAAPLAASTLTIRENSQAAVMLEVSVRLDNGKTATLSFRITAGESMLDVQGGPGLQSLQIADDAQYVVVPDFFGDDMVFDPAAIDRPRIGLPADNCLLGLCDHGSAITACIWRSPAQNASLLLRQAPSPAIAAFELDLQPTQHLWLAIIEGKDVWRARPTTNLKPREEHPLDWKPPMPAHWRADFASADGTSISTSFADPAADPADNTPPDGPCRFAEGRPMVRLLETIAAASPRLMVVYPIERTRTTPLTSFCLVDVMRNALGVGPCQYVLDAERLGNSESPTPDQVTQWIQKQFEKKPSKRDTDAIRGQLAAMALQVQRTDQRIAQYVAFGRSLLPICDDHARDPDHSQAAKRIRAIAQSMTATPPAFDIVKKLADEMAAQAQRDDAAAATHSAILAIRAAGAAQDHALARLRMAHRRITQELRLLDRPDSPLARQIEQQARQTGVQK